MLDDLLRLFVDLSANEKIEPQKIFQRVSEADGWIESLSKADDLPTITQMKPLYVSSQELGQNEAIEITFTGTHLAHKSVSLKIQDKPCDIATPAGSATSNVTFRCKTEHYGKWEPSSSISGELTLIHSPYFRWLSWLLDPMEFRYRVSLLLAATINFPLMSTRNCALWIGGDSGRVHPVGLANEEEARSDAWMGDTDVVEALS